MNSLFGEILLPSLSKEKRCDFCSRYDGEPRQQFYGLSFVSVWMNHFEEHISPPRTVNICDSCHTSIHRKRKAGRESKIIGDRMRQET